MLTGGHIPLPKDGTVTRYACRHAESMPHQRVSIGGSSQGERGARRLDKRAELELRRQRVVESRLDGLIDRGETARQVAVIDAEMATFAAKPKRRKMVGQMTPREVNAILRSLFKRTDIDPATFQPAHFEWQNPAWREESYAERLAQANGG